MYYKEQSLFNSCRNTSIATQQWDAHVPLRHLSWEVTEPKFHNNPTKQDKESWVPQENTRYMHIDVGGCFPRSLLHNWVDCSE